MRIAYLITRSDAIGGAHIHVRDLSHTMHRDHQVLVMVGGDQSFGLGGYLLFRRFVQGIEQEQGIFTLFAFVFLLLGALFIALGIIGEFTARVYAEVRRRPRYLVTSVRRGKRA